MQTLIAIRAGMLLTQREFSMRINQPVQDGGLLGHAAQFAVMGVVNNIGRKRRDHVNGAVIGPGLKLHRT